MQVAGRSPRSRLFTLPDELLAAIASELLVIRHGHVVDAHHVAVFSLTCRRVCASTRSILFNSVPLASEAQIESLALVPECLLKRVRHLAIYLDPRFVQMWRIETNDIDMVLKGRFEPPTIFTTFTRVLSQASHLCSLSFKVAESFGPGSVWRKVDATPSSHLSLDPLKDAFDLSPHFALVKLTSLRIDAFEGLEPLLRMCPNLRELNILNSGGFGSAATASLVEFLRCVPQLKSLSFSPSTIASARKGTQRHHSAWLLMAIGEALPMLERLSLQTRWLGYGAFLVSMGVEVEDLVDAISALPNLTHLYLPVSLQTSEEVLLFKEWQHRPPSVGLASSLRSLLENQRYLALQRAEERELEAIREMQGKAPQLRTVSWVRFANVSTGHRSQCCSRVEVSVQYSFDYAATTAQVASPFSGTGPGSSNLSASGVNRSSRRRIDISIHHAEDDYEDPRPTSMWTMHPHVLHTPPLQQTLIKEAVVLTLAIVGDGVHALFMLAFITAFTTVIMQHLGFTRLPEFSL